MSPEDLLDLLDETVLRVRPEEIHDQRAAGWTDWHPEDFCHRCGGANPVWFAPNDVWNRVMRASGMETRWCIVCPSCFATVARLVGLTPVWRLDAEVTP